MTYDVVGVGNALVDILAPTPDDVLAAVGLPKGSMTLVDEARSAEIYGGLGPATEQSGGSAANTIFGLGALGAHTAFIGKIRKDAMGDVFRHDLTAIGADFCGVQPEDGPATGRCLVMISPDAERTMATYLGAGSTLGPEDIDLDAVRRSRVAYMEGYLYDQAPAKAAFQLVAQTAKAAGGAAALTLSDSFCVERHRADFLALARGGVEILFANEAELKALYETDYFDAAAAQAAQDVGIAVVTRSEKGAVAIQGGSQTAVPAVAAPDLIDTTGAGDLFAAGFLRGWTSGADVTRSLEMGCLAASQVIQQIGPRPTGLKAAFDARRWTSGPAAV